MRLRPRARLDLIELWDWIADDSPRAADRFLGRVEDLCESLSRMPFMGRARPELGEGLRSFVVGEHVIFYRADEGGIEVIRVLHGRRDLGAEVF